MDKKIGFITQNDGSSVFDSFKKYSVNLNNPNNFKFSDSPNYPRAKGRVYGYQNPILGDPGRGEIARWHRLRTNVVQSLVEQMIEQFTRDRGWYSTVRCREALWNMYRRLEWWVNQNVEPGNSDYQNALSFIKDCITQILDTGEKPKIIYQHKFKEGMDESFEYAGGWKIDEFGYLSGLYVIGDTVEWEEGSELEEWSVSKMVNYHSQGLITFNYAVAGYVEKFILKMDEDIIWQHDSTDVINDTGFTFRDITLSIPAGAHKFTWILVGEMGGSLVRLDEIIFTELFPETNKPEEIPKCPLPYNHHFASDYMNYFTGVPYERPTFSTVGGSKVSDYLDMIRYVSSMENIEWELINEEGEYIFKLPLERLPETLSSKMVFNWRLKRKGYIAFKYWVDGGNGSSFLFYINNQLVGGPWRDTEGWQEVRFNMSQSQAYKFDFLVHKEVSKDLGTNAVYIKDIQVVEVTDYTDEPMPPDYAYDGEEAENEYGKWLIYSHRGALGSYYRGFPDGIEDMTREIELEFYSECDGVFGFAHKLGTEKPDRIYIDGLVFTEEHSLDEEPAIWDGNSNGVDIPTITVTPEYSGWSNLFPDGLPYVDGNALWTKNSSDIKYHVKIDGSWDKGIKSLIGSGEIGIICPPKYIAEERYMPSSLYGSWSTDGAWSSDEGVIEMSADSEEFYGSAVYEPNNKDISFVSINVTEKLLQGEKLNIYIDGYLYFSALSGFEDLFLNIPVIYGNKIKFEVEKADELPEDEKEIVFAGFFEFNETALPIDRETMFEVAGESLEINRQYSDGRGREVEIELPTGGLDTKESWYTNSGFKINLALLPKDDVIIKIPNIKVPYVDMDKLKELVDSVMEDKEIGEPKRIFYEDFNPFNSQDLLSYDSNWDITDIFKFLNIPSGGDDVIVCKGDGNNHNIDIDLSGINYGDGYLSLNFEYGALFNEGNSLELLGLINGEFRKVAEFTESTLKADGYRVNGINLPKGIEGLRFVYHS